MNFMNPCQDGARIFSELLKRPIKLIISGLVLPSLIACSLAPPYQTPPMPLPNEYKEMGTWVQTTPSIIDTQPPWWTLYHDEVLTQLEQRVTTNNENLKTAFARFQEACALAQVARSAYYPTLLGFGNVVRQKNSTTVANVSSMPVSLLNNFLLALDFNYEIDAWGRIHNAVVASENLARASQLDLATLEISMHAELASDYFALRGDEAAQHVLDKTVVAYQKALYLTRQRHEGGAAPEADVDQAETQLENAKTLAADIRLKRAQLEHAIAVLIGEIPSNFTLPIQRSKIKRVFVIPKFPSTLLEHRPDIAAAESRVKAANAEIGVARAAFFPDLNVTLIGGFQSDSIAKLFNIPSLFWSLGPSVALSLVQPTANQVIFDGYKLEGLLKKATAQYYETVSIYRQTVLTAFQEVEDALVAIRRLDEERKTQWASTLAAKRALFQANQRYKGGIATFLDVVVTENEALQSELALVTIETRRQLASIQLIKALGGGWIIT